MLSAAMKSGSADPMGDAMFDVFDADGGGNLDEQEAKRFLSVFGVADAELDECWSVVLEVVDTDGDGLIDRGEFLKWLSGETNQRLPSRKPEPEPEAPYTISFSLDVEVEPEPRTAGRSRREVAAERAAKDVTTRIHEQLLAEANAESFLQEGRRASPSSERGSQAGSPLGNQKHFE